MADFTFYGGIYRDVNIVITNNSSLWLNGLWLKGDIYSSRRSNQKERASLKIKAKLVNNNEEEKR